MAEAIKGDMCPEKYSHPGLGGCPEKVFLPNASLSIIRIYWGDEILPFRLLAGEAEARGSGLEI